MAEATRTRLTGTARRERFLDAAAQIVADLGPAAVTMEGVAARTGVNKRLAYRFFDNRDALLGQLLERELDEVGRRCRERLPPIPSLEERIAVNVRVWLETMQARGPLIRLLFDPGVVAARAFAKYSVADWAAVYKDALGVSDATAEVLARIFLGGLQGAVDALNRGTASLERVADIYTAAAISAGQAVADADPGRVAPLAGPTLSR